MYSVCWTHAFCQRSSHLEFSINVTYEQYSIVPTSVGTIFVILHWSGGNVTIWTCKVKETRYRLCRIWPCAFFHSYIHLPTQMIRQHWLLLCRCNHNFIINLVLQVPNDEFYGSKNWRRISAPLAFQRPSRRVWAQTAQLISRTSFSRMTQGYLVNYMQEGIVMQIQRLWTAGFSQSCREVIAPSPFPSDPLAEDGPRRSRSNHVRQQRTKSHGWQFTYLVANIKVSVSHRIGQWLDRSVNDRHRKV